MLAYILAIPVGVGSLAIYIAAFFFPEIHRKSDFLWSGVGLFYALILWTCAGRITGAVLLGQAASVSLLGWFGWQTFSLRRQVTPVAEQTKIPSKESAGKSVKFPEVGGTAKTETSTEVSEIVAAKELEETGQELTSVTPPEAIEEISGEIEVPTVAETPSPSELETTETLKNLTQPTPTQAETQTETKPELETPAVGETTSQEAEVKSEAKQDKAKDSSQKKAGGLSILTSPINGLVSNLKNVFGKKDKGKTKVETASKSASSEAGSTVETSETISEFETETPAVVETEVKVREEEGIAEVEIRQIEERIITDGEEEKVTVVEKETIAQVELNDSETSEVTIIEEKVTITTGEVAAEEITSEIESKEDESISLEKKEEVESPDKSEKVSPEIPSVSDKDSVPETES